jgi:hypothetical protein
MEIRISGRPFTGKNALSAITIRLATSLMPHSTKSADARRDTWSPAKKTRRAMRPGLANVKSLALAVMAAEMNFLTWFFPGTHFRRRELSVGRLWMVASRGFSERRKISAKAKCKRRRFNRFQMAVNLPTTK